MKAYFSVFRMRWRMELQYRGAVIGGVLCQMFVGLILNELGQESTVHPDVARILDSLLSKLGDGFDRLTINLKRVTIFVPDKGAFINAWQSEMFKATPKSHI